MTAPETEVLTSRGQSLADLRKAAREFGGWESLEAIAAEESQSAGDADESRQASKQGADAGK